MNQQMKSVAIKTGLLVVILGLSYWLFQIIMEPIRYQQERDARHSKVIERLIEIRSAQRAYRAVHREYTDNWDSLIHFIKTDSLPIQRTIGDPDDTLEVITDTIYVNVKDSLFKRPGYIIDSLPFIPNTGGKAKFKLEAGTLVRGGVEVPVFQVTDTKPFDPDFVLQVGSMQEPIQTGNWE
jgi:hypothetical protein